MHAGLEEQRLIPDEQQQQQQPPLPQQRQHSYTQSPVTPITPHWQSQSQSRHDPGPNLPIPRAGTSGDTFVGVAASVSAISGTTLSILGMEIDIADFTSPDCDEPDPNVFHPVLYNKSYQAFWQSILNVNTKLEKVPLPPRQDGFTYAGWYFRALNPYLPLLHQPTFISLVSRDSFRNYALLAHEKF